HSTLSTATPSLSTLSLHDALPISIANLITIPMAFLSGSFFPIENTPGWIQGLSKVFPLRHLNAGMLDVMVRGKGPLSVLPQIAIDRKSTRLNSSHRTISYAVFCLK